MTKDPLGIQAGVNLYRYSGNDPINNVDPTGLFFSSIISSVVSAIVSETVVAPVVERVVSETKKEVAKAKESLGEIGRAIAIAGTTLTNSSLFSAAGSAFGGGDFGRASQSLLVGQLAAAGVAAGGTSLSLSGTAIHAASGAALQGVTSGDFSNRSLAGGAARGAALGAATAGVASVIGGATTAIGTSEFTTAGGALVGFMAPSSGAVGAAIGLSAVAGAGSFNPNASGGVKNFSSAFMTVGGVANLAKFALVEAGMGAAGSNLANIPSGASFGGEYSGFTGASALSGFNTIRDSMAFQFGFAGIAPLLER